MRTLRSIAPLVVVGLILTGCAGGTDDPDAATAGSAATVEESSPQETGSGHGEIEGAEEVAEPQLHLVSIDRTGAVGMLNLLDGTSSEPGGIDPPTAVTSDGRYLFADTDSGVEIVDSGVWTWDHVDHFHYYRTSPSVLGTVAGEGSAVVTTSGNATTGGTGVFFPESGEAVLLSNEALSEGRIEEVFRLETEPHDGLAAPLGSGALVTSVDESGRASGVGFHGADGSPVDGATAPCADAQGAATTRIGVVVGCADGALLATYSESEPRFEHIAFPDGTQAPRATDFRGRKGRPAVAALAGDQGFWLLDTRARVAVRADRGAVGAGLRRERRRLPRGGGGPAGPDPRLRRRGRGRDRCHRWVAGRGARDPGDRRRDRAHGRSGAGVCQRPRRGGRPRDRLPG
ncbi:hypothetical protein [Dietzia psychralcaliphila]|uniref:hypothetical protein n=1 Tax=Dietzia psychralcaliphila TaxID=139021 RepID=UPI001C1E5CCF|nr:hypothetical protein [Dietzia psychralcaliphila]